jgi:8-amino-7-oxononanoate synthase
MAFEFVTDELQSRKQKGLLRQRQCVTSQQNGLLQVDGQYYLNFSSNDYLGMRSDFGVMQSWCDAMVKYGLGSGASPLVTGFSEAHRSLEDYLADALGYESVLLFSSGFAANQALCQTLLKQNTYLIADKLIHASVIEGARNAASQGSNLKRYKHNDCEHLATLLSKTDGDTLIATEGVFSMDGDQAPLGDIANLANQHNAWVVVDDAHGFGVLGDTGLGSLEAQGLDAKKIPILMGTFGKAIGTAGAFVAGSRSFVDYLVNCSKHTVYSTAMPPAQAVATQTSIEKIRTGGTRESLFGNIAQFKALAKQAGLAVLESQTAIQPILVPGPDRALRASEALRKLGIWVTAIRYPTVPKGKDRLRIAISAVHRADDISALVEALSLVLLNAEGKSNE